MRGKRGRREKEKTSILTLLQGLSVTATLRNIPAWHLKACWCLLHTPFTCTLHISRRVLFKIWSSNISHVHKYPNFALHSINSTCRNSRRQFFTDCARVSHCNERGKKHMHWSVWNIECSSLCWAVRRVSLPLQCKGTGRKIAIIALTLLCFHHTNLTLGLARIHFIICSYDLQAIGMAPALRCMHALI